MDLEDSDKKILEESGKSYDISRESIKSYDLKIQQILVISTGILAFIFTIGGFFSVEFIIENIEKNIILYFGYFASLISIFFLLIYSIILCLKTYTMLEYGIIRPLSLWNGLSTYTDKKKFMNDLIEEIDYNTCENIKKSYDLWNNYTKAIALLGSGIGLQILLVIFAIFIKIAD